MLIYLEIKILHLPGQNKTLVNLQVGNSRQKYSWNSSINFPNLHSIWKLWFSSLQKHPGQSSTWNARSPSPPSSQASFTSDLNPRAYHFPKAPSTIIISHPKVTYPLMNRFQIILCIKIIIVLLMYIDSHKISATWNLINNSFARCCCVRRFFRLQLNTENVRASKESKLN